MKRFITLVAALAICFAGVPAFADSVHIGGTENITNQGGTATATGGNATSSSSSSAGASAGATAISNPVQVTTQGQQQGQHQGQGQQQGQGQGQKQGQVNQPNQTIEGDNVRVYASPPSMVAPALAAVPETCMGSTSTALSGGNGMIGVGLSFGSTWKSESCEQRMFARSLAQLGQERAALALLAQNENVKKALEAAGVAIPGAKKADVTEEPKKTSAVTGPQPVVASAVAPVLLPTDIHGAMVYRLAESQAGVQGQ